MRPWYIPTWVNGMIPVTSPIAHTPSAARHRSSTPIPFGSTSMPTLSSPMGGPRRGLLSLDPRALLEAAGFDVERTRRAWVGYPSLCVRAVRR